MSQNSKGGPFGAFENFRKKVSAEKIEGGTLWSRSVFYVTLEKEKK